MVTVNRNHLCRALLLALPAFWMLGCSASSRLQSSLGNRYRYFLSLSAPQKSDALLFRDERIIIQFRFDDPAIRFQLQNISPGSLQVDWPHASLALGGPLLPVRNVSTYYDTTSVPPLSPPIPPLGVIRDVVVPKSSMSVRGNQWQSVDLFPTTDGNSFERESAIAGMIGRTIELTLPMIFGVDVKTYRFVFSVDSVKPMSWSEYRGTPWLPPAPPLRSLGPSSEDKITAAIIVGGFAGYLRYVMTMKKSPVVE